MSLPPSRDSTPLEDPSHDYVQGPPPKRTRVNLTPSPHKQVHKVYGEDKNHWFVQCQIGRLTKDHPAVTPLGHEVLATRMPVDTEHCNNCFSTRERMALRRKARARMHSVPEPANGS